MTITLTPELEAAIQRKIDRGHFQSPVEVVAAAIEWMNEEDEILTPYKGQLNAMLDESMAAADRGELYTPEQAREYLAKMRRSL